MKIKIGKIIRRIRESQDKTMKEVSSQAGVSESLISQIERDKVNPAIDTLLSICDVLDIDMEYLFRGYRKKRKAVFVKREEREVISKKNVRYEKLSRFDNDGRELEAYLMTVIKGDRTGRDNYGHKGMELGLILEGECELRLGGEKYELKEGDSISFDSLYPHELINRGEDDLKALWVTSPPKKL